MVKVLQVVRTMDLGGLETVVKNILEIKTSKNVICDCLICDEQETDMEADLLIHGVCIYKIAKPDVIKVALYANIGRFLKKHQGYDIVHTHMGFSNGVVALAAKRCGVKCVVCHSHGVQLPKESKWQAKPYQALMRYLMFHNAEYMLACSKQAGDYLFGETAYRVKGQVFKNGIDINSYGVNSDIRFEIRAKYSINGLCIGTVGAINEVKNQKVLIDLIEQREEWQALLVGDGPLRKDLEQYAKKKGVADRVLFVGKQSNVEPFLQAMDVFVFPSISEGFGIALLEAQANGLPSVVSDAITNEVKVASNIYTVSLLAPVEQWQNAILLATQAGRRDNSEALKNCEMDLCKNVRQLHKLYEEICNETIVENTL